MLVLSRTYSLLVVAAAVLVVLSGTPGTVYGLNNGLALTPQMGWNSWNLFGCNINQTLIMNTAQAMISSGLSKFGYTYVVYHRAVTTYTTNKQEANQETTPKQQ
jgi:alpha-galactosidase